MDILLQARSFKIKGSEGGLPFKANSRINDHHNNTSEKLKGMVSTISFSSVIQFMDRLDFFHFQALKSMAGFFSRSMDLVRESCKREERDNGLSSVGPFRHAG